MQSPLIQLKKKKTFQWTRAKIKPNKDTDDKIKFKIILNKFKSN